MRTAIWLLVVATLHGSVRAGPALGQQPAAPDSSEAWFLRDLDVLTRGTGRWLADNAAYVGPDEPWRTYGLEWRRGLSRRTAHGRLFGVEADGSERDFWEFYVYWDAVRHAAVMLQTHVSAAAFGIGDMTWTRDGEHEIVQTFRWEDGSTRRTRHLERVEGNVRHSASFDWEAGDWTPRRTYRWVRVAGP